MIEHAGLCGVSGRDEQVMAAAVNQTTLEPGND